LKRNIYKSKQGREISGVCAGLAEYLGCDAEVVRIFFSGLALFWGLGVWIYLWLMLKLKEKPENESNC